MPEGREQDGEREGAGPYAGDLKLLAVQRQLAATRLELSEKEAALAVATGEAEAARERAARLEAAGVVLGETNEQVQGLQAELQAASALAAEARARAAELEEAQARGSAERSELESAFLALRAQLEGAQAELRRAQEAAQDKDSALEEARRQGSGLQLVLDQRDEELRGARAEVERQRETAEEAGREATLQLGQASARAAKAEAEAEQLKAVISSSEESSALERATEQLTSLQARLQEQGGQLELEREKRRVGSEAREEEREGLLAHLQDQTSAFSEHIAEQEARLHELQTALVQAKGDAVAARDAEAASIEALGARHERAIRTLTGALTQDRSAEEQLARSEEEVGRVVESLEALLAGLSDEGGEASWAANDGAAGGVPAVGGLSPYPTESMPAAGLFPGSAIRNESSFAFPSQPYMASPSFSAASFGQPTLRGSKPDIGLQLGGVKSQMEAFLQDPAAAGFPTSAASRTPAIN